jgi:WS/DGAT/MGAT family acyltransferase
MIALNRRSDADGRAGTNPWDREGPSSSTSAGYERLSKLDQAFLTFETPTTPMHVALTAIFEAGPLATRDGGVAVARVRAHVASRLHLIPRYRQRLLLVPLVKDAVWVDDPDFDLDYHVRHVSLRSPGNDEQLRDRCAEILERPLNRARPLWESWVIGGLAGGRFALLTKVHHCMVDGVGGVELLGVLLDAMASNEPSKVPPWRPRPAPGGGELVRDTMLRRGQRLLNLGRNLRPAVSDPRRSVRAIGNGIGALWSLVTSGIQRPHATPFNGPVGRYRRTAWLSMNLNAVKALGKKLGGTVNDVALATVASGLRRTLERRRAAAKDMTLKVAVPINVRTTAECGELGNRVSVMFVRLPLDASDPIAQLRMVRDATARLKGDGQSGAVGLLIQAAEWTSGNVLHLAVRLISSAGLYNLIVTNVPGPPLPFFLLGARMVASYPHLPLFENQGLGIAILSYAGELYWGLTADPHLMPDLDDLAADISATFQELCGIAAVEPAGNGSPHHPTPTSVRRGRNKRWPDGAALSGVTPA